MLDGLRALETDVADAVSDRRVSLRPAPETTARLTALLPVAQGVACYVALLREADTARSQGDQRGRGQVTDPLPAPIARDLAPIARDLGTNNDSESDGARRWIRRLFTRPDTGQLVALESRRRVFTPGQRRFLQLQDQWCRTPYCDAPIRHADHIQPAENGGPTCPEHPGSLRNSGAASTTPVRTNRCIATGMLNRLLCGVWRSLVACFVRDEEAAGSNPVTPTNHHGPSSTLTSSALPGE